MSTDNSNPQWGGANYQPPGQSVDLGALARCLQDAGQLVGTTYGNIAQRLTDQMIAAATPVENVAAALNSRLAGQLDKQQAIVEGVNQQVLSRVAYNAGAAIPAAAAAVDGVSQAAGIGCTGNEPTPYVDWCIEDGDIVYRTICGFYGAGDCPEGSFPVLHSTTQGQFTECRVRIDRPSGFNRGRDCATGSYVGPQQPSSGAQTPLPSMSPIIPPTTGGSSVLPTIPIPSEGSGAMPQPSIPLPVPPTSGSTPQTSTPSGGSSSSGGGDGQCCPAPEITCPAPNIYLQLPSYPGQQIPLQPLQPVVPAPVVPIPTTPPPGQHHTYCVWCNPQTGQVDYTRDDQDDKYGPWNLIECGLESPNANEQLIQWLCEQGYKKERKKKPYGSGGGLPSQSISSIQCYIDQYCGQNAGVAIASIAKDTLNDAQIVANASAALDANFGLLNAVTLGLGASFIAAAKSSVLGRFAMIETFATTASALVAAGDPVYTQLIELHATLSGICGLTGMPFDVLATPINYAINGRHRLKHLSPGEATAAYLADAIDVKNWDCYQAIAGLCPEDALASLKAGRSKPVPAELAALRLRGIITADEYDAGMRQLGYLEPEVRADLFKLSEELPPVQDIIRFMVRDTDDNNVVSDLELDALFAAKFGMQLKDWAAQQGVPELMMRHYWRAHWKIPAPDQLFEFWHRLRRKPEFGTPDQQLKDITTALVHNDILPHWHKQYLATQYLPLPNRMLRQAFIDGTLEEQELNDGYAAVGYSDDDCDKIVEFVKRERYKQSLGDNLIHQWTAGEIDADAVSEALQERHFDADTIDKLLKASEFRFANSPWGKAFQSGELNQNLLKVELSQQGVSDDGIDSITRRLSYLVKSIPEISDYAAGLIDRQGAENAARDYGISELRSKVLLDNIDRKLRQETTTVCTKGIKRRLALGEITEGQARNLLINRGLVNPRVNLLLEQWACEQAARGKAAPTATLCQWYSKGQITPLQFNDRLTAVGWSTEDAARIVADCSDRINQQLTKRAEAEAKQRAAAQEKAAREIAKAAGSIERQRSAALKASQQAALASERREKQLLHISALLLKQSDCELPQAVSLVRALHSANRTEYHLTMDESIATLSQALTALKVPYSCEAYQSAVQALRDATVSDNQSGAAREVQSASL